MRANHASCNGHAGGNQSPRAWAQWVSEKCAERDVDVLHLQEMSPPLVHELHQALGPDWQVSVHRERPGANETAVAVRRAFSDVLSSRSVSMGGRTWIGRQTGRRHTPRSMCTARLEVGYDVASVHAPPNVDVRRGELRGEAQMIRAWVAYWSAFLLWAKRRRRPWVAMGDLNESPQSVGRWSPRQVARVLRAKIRGRRIDAVLASRHFQLGPVTYVPAGPGMDHPMAFCTVVLA